MTVRQLTIAAALIVVALTPSIADVAHAHTSERHMLPVLWGWIALAVVIALLLGDELTGRAG